MIVTINGSGNFTFHIRNHNILPHKMMGRNRIIFPVVGIGTTNNLEEKEILRQKLFGLLFPAALNSNKLTIAS